MNAPLRRSLALGLAAGMLYALPARADAVRSAGQTLVYSLTVANNSKPDLSGLPASMRGQAEAQVAMGNKTPAVYVLTLTADRVDADGSAHVNVSYTYSLENKNTPGAAAVFAKYDRFQGTLTADGRFVPTYDPNMKMTYDSKGMSPPDQTANVNASVFVGHFGDFNVFAGGCAKRAQYKAGDVWRVQSVDAYGQSRTYDFAVTSVDANAVPTVTMMADLTGPASSSKIDATGHYDAARRLVIDLHEVNVFSGSSPAGGSSSGTTTTDFKLQ